MFDLADNVDELDVLVAQPNGREDVWTTWDNYCPSELDCCDLEANCWDFDVRYMGHIVDRLKAALAINKACATEQQRRAYLTDHGQSPGPFVAR